MYDVIIVGAGPAGCACALSLSKSGLKVIIIEKVTFPRDKICGDALSVDVVNQLAMLPGNTLQQFLELPHKLPSYGVKIYSPDGHSVDIPFLHKGNNHHGYLCTRFDFDDFLFKQVIATSNIDVLVNCTIEKITVEAERVAVQTLENGMYYCSLIIGADGAQSVVQKLTGRPQFSRRHHSAGLRVYYEGVSGFHDKNHIELFFLKETLPGYLWVFPMANGRANVGLGMLSAVVSKHKINLKKVLKDALATHPELKKRFQDAHPLETVKGFGLPLGSEKRQISGNRFLLTGDAAGLIDPFSGEGIGNAIRSGRVAAVHTINCLKIQNFSAEYNKSYDQEIYKRMSTEFAVSHALQRLARHSWLINFIVRKAGKSKFLESFLTDALADVNQKKKLSNPMLYYRLLFR